MNIIVLGAGEIGRHIAISLSQVAHSIVVIESDPVIAQELEEQLDARVINANGTSVETLLESGVAECDLFVAIGTSGHVYPAAGFVEIAASSNAKTLEINLEKSQVASQFEKGLYGLAGEQVPFWVDSVLQS